MEKGHFRYNFCHPECKKLPGRIGYLAQFNPDRVTARRAPEAMKSVKQPLDLEKFNFNKVDSDKELVFQITRTEQQWVESKVESPRPSKTTSKHFYKQD
jgi:hypothetical protein